MQIHMTQLFQYILHHLFHHKFQLYVHCKMLVDLFCIFFFSCDPRDHNATQVSVNNGVVCDGKWLSKRNCAQYTTCTECLAKWPSHINEVQVTMISLLELCVCVLNLLISQTVYS